MATFSLEDTVKTFTYHQALVVYWFGKELSNENIAARYGYTKSWVVWQMSQVYFKLGLDRKDASGRSLHWSERRRILKEKVCPIIERLINDDPDLLDRFPLISPNVLEGSIVDLRPEIPVPPSGPLIPLPDLPPEPPSVPPDDQIPPPVPPPDFYPIELYNAWLAVLEDGKHDDPPLSPPPIVVRAPERRGIMWGRLLGLGLVVLLGCVAVGALAYWLGRNDVFAPATETSMTTIETSIPTTPLTTTIEPSATIQLTDTLSPPPTNTPPPTENLTPSAVPTIPALFFDDFTNGKSDQWEVLYGSPLFVNGTMTFDEITLMAVPEAWTDVEVSFDLSNMQCQRHVGSRGITVALRYQDLNNMVALRIFDADDCAATWFLVKNGEMTEMPNSTFPLPPLDSNGVRHWVMSVQGNRYSSPFGIPIVIEDFPTGGVSIMVDPGVTVDNFQVTAIAP